MKPFLIVLTLLCANIPLPAQQPSPLPETNAQRMGQRLRKIFESNDWKADPNKQAERATYYAQLLKQLTKLGDRTTVALELANEQLRIGESSASITTLEDLGKQLADAKLTLPANIDQQLHRELALAYLRLGEQENCLAMHVTTA